MKRAHGKIKDFIEPQAFEEMADHVSNPARSLAAYRFTDATSELFVYWLDALANLPRGRGAARALAGLRGVGKSHALAAFSALAAEPRLRSTVPDAHVATSARRLLDRRYPVAHVQRGTRATLTDEIAASFSRVLGGAEAEWRGAPAQMLAIAASRAGDAPLVVSIDTAAGREARVRRDDGPLLSELAKAVSDVHAFIVLALDDDIEGADGANIGVSGSFEIAYLDQEHLYKVADQHFFQKNAAARAALHDIYTMLREAVPGFNWSERRFATIYPVHPLIPDVAPTVRLYAPGFAFLPFACGAVARAINRPAPSLVVLDEVFDSTEATLRKSPELKVAFETYDHLVVQGVGALPVMSRLEAKLVLKGLFILSLDGRGATARELGAAMLLYDEADPAAAMLRIEEILRRLLAVAKPRTMRRVEDRAEFRYRFVVSASEEFETELTARAAAMTVYPAAIREILMEAGRARFQDWRVPENDNTPPTGDLIVRWRGLERHGSLVWRDRAETGPPARPGGITPRHARKPEFEVIALGPGAESPAAAVFARETDASDAAVAPVRVCWQPAALRAEEIESLRRLMTLREDASLSATFGETARAAERSLVSTAEGIWSRIYLEQGTLCQEDGSRRPFTEAARSATTLSAAFSDLLAPFFEALYPMHPSFPMPLGEVAVAHLVAGFFGGSKGSGDVALQDLARKFAQPLGLTRARGDVYAPEAGDRVLEVPWVRDVLAMADEAGGDIVSIDDIYARLHAPPFGILEEAQRLILAALVAQRRIELVTAGGDRIGRRTLDLRVRWDEVTGIARAAALLHSAEELTAWARLLTGDVSAASIADPSAREAARESLRRWRQAWDTEGLLDNLDAIPDDTLTTRTSGLALAIRKTFGAAAEAVSAALQETLSLDEGLQRVADAFGDSAEVFERSSSQLRSARRFVSGLAERRRARQYLAGSEPGASGTLDRMRSELIAIAEDPHNFFDEETSGRFDRLWQAFHAEYTTNYVSVHELVLGKETDRASVEAITGSAEWREFEALSQLPIVNPKYWEDVTEILGEIGRDTCDLPVRELLEVRPRCACGLRLSDAEASVRRAQALTDLVRRGLEAHWRTFYAWGKHFASDPGVTAAVDSAWTTAESKDLISALAEGRAPAPLAPAEIELISSASQHTTAAPLQIYLPPDGYGLLTREELAARLQQWLEEVPNYSALLDVVSVQARDDG